MPKQINVKNLIVLSHIIIILIKTIVLMISKVIIKMIQMKEQLINAMKNVQLVMEVKMMFQKNAQNVKMIIYIFI
jgi:hypothetical protein